MIIPVLSFSFAVAALGLIAYCAINLVRLYRQYKEMKKLFEKY